MAGRLKYGLRVHYPHMIDSEIRVWENFMNKFPDRFDSVDYDFRVGNGVVLPEYLGSEWGRMAKMLSQKRIDVIGWNGDSPTIIEIKERVGLSAMGQVLGYKTLFRREFLNFPDPELLIICERISGDDQDVLNDNGIPVFVV